jgi:hypothetical protein
VGASGKIYNIKKIDTTYNAVTVTGTSSQTFDGVTSFKLGQKNMTASVQSDGANWVFIKGPVSYVRYTTNASQSLTSGSRAVIDFEDVDKDFQSEVTTGAAWVFTAKWAGLYQVNANCVLSGTWTTTNGRYARGYVYKNSSIFAEQDYEFNWTVAAGNMDQWPVQMSSSVWLDVGDTINFRIEQSTNSTLTLDSASEKNSITIVRVGA